VLAASLSGKAISLSWTKPSDGGSAITGYRIYRGMTAASLSLHTPVGGSVTAFKDTSVSRRTTYYYAVSALTSAGEGTRSNTVSIRTR
jgi:hypothetical protein